MTGDSWATHTDIKVAHDVYAPKTKLQMVPDHTLIMSAKISIWVWVELYAHTHIHTHTWKSSLKKSIMRRDQLLGSFAIKMRKEEEIKNQVSVVVSGHSSAITTRRDIQQLKVFFNIYTNLSFGMDMSVDTFFLPVMFRNKRKNESLHFNIYTDHRQYVIQ